jgi:hypothetical protein
MRGRPRRGPDGLSISSKGVGIYAFVEIADRTVASALGANALTADLVQPVELLPRDGNGGLRMDILYLIAMNQIALLDRLIGNDKELAKIAAPIAAGRLNLADRRISRLEKPVA